MFDGAQKKFKVDSFVAFLELFRQREFIFTDLPTIPNAHWERYKRIKYLKPFSEGWKGFSRHNCRHVLWMNTAEQNRIGQNIGQNAGEDSVLVAKPTTSTNKTEYFILSKIHLHYFNLPTRLQNTYKTIVLFLFLSLTRSTSEAP